MVIETKDGDITTKNNTIKDLEAEVSRLLNSNAADDQASQDILKQLAEAQVKYDNNMAEKQKSLDEANKSIEGLNNQIKSIYEKN